MRGFPVENGRMCQKDPESPLPRFTFFFFFIGVVMFCLNENIPCNRDVLAVFIYLSTGPETVAGGSDVGRSQDVKGVEENLKYSRYRDRKSVV